MYVDEPEMIRNRYKIIKFLGTGAFGETHLAEDTANDNERVVVKRLMMEHLNEGGAQRAKELFIRESETLRKLGKPNSHIPQQIDYVEENDDYYIIMEYVEGENLSQQELREGNKLNKEEVINLLVKILEILKFVHEHKFIHRDIKPENIIRRTDDQELVLIDFGSVTSAPPDKDNLIQIGTTPYSPPEQFQIEAKVDFCSDIYAVGIIGIQSLIGRCPNNLNYLDDGEIAWEHLSSVSTDLKEVIKKMVKLDPNERYQTVAQVLKALKRIQNKNIFNRILPFCFGISIGLGLGAFGYARLFPDISIPIEERTEWANVDNFANQFLTKCQNEIKLNPEQKIIKQNEEAKLKEKQKKRQIIRIAVMIPGQGNRDCLGDATLAYSFESLRGIADSQQKLLSSNNSELIQIVIVNYDNDQRKAQYLAKEIANDITIFGVIVVGSSSKNRIILDVIKKSEKLVMITSTASATTLGKNITNFYRTNSSDQSIAQTLTDYFSKKAQTDPIKKVAIFYTTEKGDLSYSNLLKQDFEQILPNNHIKLDFINVKKQSWKNEYNQLKNSKVDGIIVLPEFDELDWATDLIKYNSSSENLPIFGGDTLSQPQVIKSAGEAAKGTIISVPWTYSPEYCYQGKWGGAISWRTATSYDALQAFIHTIKAHNGKNINRSSMQQKIREVNLSEENCETSGKPLHFYDNLGQKLDRKPDLIEITDDKERCQNRQYPNSNLCYSQLDNKD